MTPERLGEIREAEQRAAAGILGVAGLTFLLHEDCELEETLAFRCELSSLIRTLRPDVLMTHDPWARYRIHPDHRAVGFTALAAIVTAGNQMLREGLPPHFVGEICLFQTDNPDFWVDITDTFELKLRAIREHRSQTAHSGEAMMKRVLEWAETAGKEAGVALAEGFKAILPRHWRENRGSCRRCETCVKVMTVGETSHRPAVAAVVRDTAALAGPTHSTAVAAAVGATRGTSAAVAVTSRVGAAVAVGIRSASAVDSRPGRKRRQRLRSI